MAITPSSILIRSGSTSSGLPNDQTDLFENYLYLIRILETIYCAKTNIEQLKSRISEKCNGPLEINLGLSSNI